MLSLDAAATHAEVITNTKLRTVEQELELLCRRDLFSINLERKQNLLHSVFF